MNIQILLALAVNEILVKAADDSSMLAEEITSLGLESLVSEVPEIESIIANTALLSSLIDDIDPAELSSIEAQLGTYKGTAVDQELSSIIAGLTTVGVNQYTPTYATYVITSGSVTSTYTSYGLMTGSGGTASTFPSKTSSTNESKATSRNGSQASSSNKSQTLSTNGSKPSSTNVSKGSSSSTPEASSKFSSSSKGPAAVLTAPAAVFIGAVGLALL